jgi:hypothetical protein
MTHFDMSAPCETPNLKATHTSNVASSDAVYLPANGSRVQTPDQTHAALAKVGNGKVGFAGDANLEAETTSIILALCGIVRPPSENAPWMKSFSFNPDGMCTTTTYRGRGSNMRVETVTG